MKTEKSRTPDKSGGSKQSWKTYSQTIRTGKEVCSDCGCRCGQCESLDAESDTQMARRTKHEQKGKPKYIIRLDIMTPSHSDWDEFCELLFESLGSSLPGRCRLGHEHAIAILRTIPGINVKRSLKYFMRHGGGCDCEILFNVGIHEGQLEAHHGYVRDSQAS